MGRTVMRVNGLTISALTMLMALAACSDDEPRLMNIDAHRSTPDEFAILPTKPLQLPPDLAALPTPTPGGTNITDPTPDADVVAALGGNPAQLSAVGVSPSDAGLLAYSGRFGRDGAIRQTLAAEDLEWRRANAPRFLEKLAKTNVYYRAYQSMWLDQRAELLRWQRAGAQTPSAPPRTDK
ncbi:DUF3035 domain-containing protein [Paracoccus pacificus]|uniref:DUF3035 domain-containing protein n=1 Tax=Paracoccus pacificus TaxID=1463598 RepID=A0ABW4R6L7_9RHOB